MFKDGVPSGFWDSEKNIEEVKRFLQKQLNIRTAEDWFSGKGLYLFADIPVNYQQLEAFRLLSLVKKVGGFSNLLKKLEPSLDWNSTSQNFKGSKSQMLMFEYIQELFPGKIKKNAFLTCIDVDVLFDYTTEDLIFGDTSKKMQLDVFIPHHKLAFEFQGEQHFGKKDTYLNSERGIKRDAEKRETLKKNGITLIEVPYWWDHSKESLKATIHLHRPALISGDGKPIPESPTK